MRTRWIGAFAGAGAAAVIWIATSGEAAPRRSVVAYLVSATADSSVAIENEFMPDRRRPAHPWHWRVFDPVSGRDTLVLALASFPTRVRWDPDFRFVEYAIANRIEQADWRVGARPRVQTVLPVDTSLCDFWSDRDGHWHLITQEEGEHGQRIARWDQKPDGTWRVAAVDTVESDYAVCLETPRVVGPGRPAVVPLRALLDSMAIGHHRVTDLRAFPDGTGLPPRLVWVPTDIDTAIGLEVKVETGDTEHAMEPVVWVDRRSGRRSVVCPVGGTHDETSGQVAFAQRDGFLLVTAEYSGAYPIVADLRTGRVVLRVARPSARAVWVTGPR